MYELFDFYELIQDLPYQYTINFVQNSTFPSSTTNNSEIHVPYVTHVNICDRHLHLRRDV